jgi:hypothetical protein
MKIKGEAMKHTMIDHRPKIKRLYLSKNYVVYLEIVKGHFVYDIFYNGKLFKTIR